jgi:para-aminobenzoate synthetase / 4-amino-4-deoxychorismate lyase
MPAAPPDRPDPAAGVFETLLVRDGRAPALARHLERLARSLQRLHGLSLPAELPDDLRVRAALLAGEHRLRVDLVVADGAVRVTVTASPLAADRTRPVALAPVVVPGGLGSHKWRDRRLLDRLGPDPVPLVVDSDDSVLEAAWANFWILDGDRLITPPADGRLLPGVTRARLLELAPSLGLHAGEQPIPLAHARTAGTVFLTSSLRLAVPASFQGTPSPHATAAIARIRSALALS